MAEAQTIAAGLVVTVHYKLTLDDGQVVDSSEGDEPMAYLHGRGNIVPGLEAALEGKTAGEDLKVSVSPEEGYGVRRPDALHQVNRSAFPEDAKLEVGIAFQAMDEHENPIAGTITAIENDEITVDFNHPLAGRTLNFEVQIIEIRPATAEEQSHGHVHGPGGHPH